MRYAAKNLKRVPLDMQRTQYDDLKAHAEARGETVNGFIKRAISETMERDNEPGRDDLSGLSFEIRNRLRI